MTALAVVLLWAAYLVRDVLLLIYISGLLAIGFSPIVRADRAADACCRSARGASRAGWRSSSSTSFIIGVLVGIGFLVVPPLVASGAGSCGAPLPEMFDQRAGSS